MSGTASAYLNSAPVSKKSFETGVCVFLKRRSLEQALPKGVFLMLTLDKVFNAQMVLKDVVNETSVVRAYGIAPDCELYLKPENL